MSEIDTSTEAVERLAKDGTTLASIWGGYSSAKNVVGYSRGDARHYATTYGNLSDTLRALAAERDRLLEELKLAEGMYLTLEKMHESQRAAPATARAETAAWLAGRDAAIAKQDCGCKADRSDCLRANGTVSFCYRDGLADVRDVTPPADATAALDETRRQERAAGKAEGMREAAGIANAVWERLSHSYMCEGAKQAADAILARAAEIEKVAAQ
ncbi:hypothetical protein ORIO_12355 [Cereibacter azotoformans]|uniref:hypothetical protein n=1 Tax=Cereibacter azotoformans TaxID=43057 RepID=UPI001EEBA77F|nr:hypothetical protein [Cereibacter azotoformans]ULB10695.1 hypothetical protein ORIO_12355 [Cereibacter azotoformans]